MRCSERRRVIAVAIGGFVAAVAELGSLGALLDRGCRMGTTIVCWLVFTLLVSACRTPHPTGMADLQSRLLAFKGRVKSIEDGKTTVELDESDRKTIGDDLSPCDQNGDEGATRFPQDTHRR